MTTPVLRPTDAARAEAATFPRDPAESQYGATQGQAGAAVAEDLARAARLLAEAAEILGNLAQDPDIRLAVSGNGAVMGAMSVAAPGPATPPKLFSANDVAGLVGVSGKTIRRWRTEGKTPPGIVLGGVVRWQQDDINNWLKGLKDGDST